MKKLLTLLCALSIVLSGCAMTDTSSDVEYALWDAIDSGILEAVKEAVENGADINEFHNKKYHERTYHNQKVSSPLMLALFDGRFQIAEYLISCGADVNCADMGRGESLLQYCCEFYPPLVETVINAGADIFYEDSTGRTALDYCTICDYNYVEGQKAFEALLAHGAMPTQNTVDELTANFEFNRCGMLNIIASSEASQYMDELSAAAFKGEYVNVPSDRMEDYILFGIASFGSWENLSLYLEYIDQDKACELTKAAVLFGNAEVIKGMTENYSGMETPDLTDYLSLAVMNGDVNIVELVRNTIGGADAIAADTAISAFDNELLMYFINTGLDLNSSSIHTTLLDACAQCNNYDAAKILIEHGAAANDDALTRACKLRYLDLAKLLVENGADANGKNLYSDGSGGQSVLMQSIYSGQLESVKFLIEQGADIYYEYAGHNAIEEAERCGSKRIYEYVLSQAV